MINLFKNKEEKDTFVSTYSNPFKSDKCDKITFEIENSWWTSGAVRYQANIRFQSGDTHGYHTIKADDFPSLVKKTEEFLKGL